MLRESLSPGWSSPLLPEIHRLIVLQMLDLNSCVLNQDCGKQQQKLVYTALLSSDGNFWGWGEGEQSSDNSLDISTPRKELLTAERICDKTLFLTPRCLPFTGGWGGISICCWPTSWWTPYPAWGPHLKPHEMLGQQPPPPPAPLLLVCGSAHSATWPKSSPDNKIYLTCPSCYLPEITGSTTTVFFLFPMHKWYWCSFLTMVDLKLYIYIWPYSFNNIV